MSTGGTAEASTSRLLLQIELLKLQQGAEIYCGVQPKVGIS
jgi:hypothetical protein